MCVRVREGLGPGQMGQKKRRLGGESRESGRRPKLENQVVGERGWGAWGPKRLGMWKGLPGCNRLRASAIKM